MLERPGGTGRTTDREDVSRGTGFAVGFKNIGFSEGFDDYSTARVRLADGAATVTCACAEIGQGFVTLAQQITREVLGVDDVVLTPADTSIGSAGSTSASRQTWISGGAVQAAAEAVRHRLLEHVARARHLGPEQLVLVDGRVRTRAGTAPSLDLSVAEASAGIVLEETLEYHHAPTVPLDDDGQGDAHLAFAFAAHRAVVDVDPELGLVRLVELTTSQEVGRVLNPLQLLGQLEGGAAQGVGLAVMEEIVVDAGPDAEPLVHRLPHPHRAGPARAVGGRGHRGARAGRAVRRQGGGRAADHLVGRGGGQRHPGGHRSGPAPGAGAALRHRSGRGGRSDAMSRAAP